MGSPSPNGHRYLVTGGHGFIGRRVVARLVATGHDVVCPYRNPQELVPDLPGWAVEVNLMDPAAVRDVVAGCDGVVHLAAKAGGIRFQEGSQADLFRYNQALTGNVLAAAEAAGCRRVFLASSAVIYADHPPTPIAETARIVAGRDAPSAYAWSKVSDEVVGGWYQRSGVFEVVVGRFTNVYGPHRPGQGPATVVHDLITRAGGLEPGGSLEVWGDGSAVRSFVYVDDAAAGVVAVVERGEPGTAYNVDAGDTVSIRDLAGIVRDTVDPSIRLVFDPSKPAGTPFRALDGSRLRGLGWRPSVGLTEGVTRTSVALLDRSA